MYHWGNICSNTILNFYFFIHIDAPISKEEVFKQPANANQIWTDVDLGKLAKLIKKYPAGSVDRWEKIADILERTTKEVTKMAYKIKDNAFIIPTAQKTQGKYDTIWKICN